MNMHARGMLPACAAILALVLLAGCDALTVAPQADAPKDGQAILEYLRAAREDFTVIEILLTDHDLKLLDENTTFGNKLSDESIDKYLGILDGYDTTVGTRLATIKSREPPGSPDIASFNAAEILEFETACDIIKEYIQILKYTDSMLAIDEKLKRYGNIGPSGSQAAYMSYSADIVKAISGLKANDVPSFLKSMNGKIIVALDELNEATLYSLHAASINDPVRANAAGYRMGAMLRNLDIIGDEANQDIIGREARLKADLKGIWEKNASLRDWAQKNINKLSEN